MQIRDRYFPYPILNNNPNLSDYKKSSSFKLLIEKDKKGGMIRDNDDNIVLKNTHFKLENSELSKLYQKGFITCNLIVECSSTLFRKTYNISTLPQDFTIPISKLKDRVFFSAYMTVNKDLKNYFNSDFTEDYLDYKFNIGKHSIIAADDGFSIRIDIEEDKDNKVSSIFTIVREDSNSKTIKYDNDRKSIKIYMPPSYYKEYEMLKHFSDANNIVFGVLVIPILSSCIEEVKSRFNYETDINQITEDYLWFKSVYSAYKDIKGDNFDLQEMLNENSFVLAQSVMNYATSEGLKDFNELLKKGVEDDE